MILKYLLCIFLINVIYCESYDEVSEFKELLKVENDLLVLFTEECCTCAECIEAETLLGAISVTFEDNFNLPLVRLKKPNLRRKYGVKSVPALVFIRDGKPALYEGVIEKDAVYFWVGDNRNALTKELDDESFEHLTQAASGATTGDWLIAFYDDSCIKNTGLISYLEGAGTLIKRTVNVATVDINKAPNTAERFKIKACPEIIFFRHGKMYRYNLPEKSVGTLKTFAEGFYKHSKTEVVPAPVTFFDKLLDKIVLYLKQYWSYIFFCLSVIIFLIVVIIACFSRSKIATKSEVTKKSN